MGETKIRYRVVRVADNTDDQKTASDILGSLVSSVSQEDLQEFLLSQIKRIIHGNHPGTWRDDFEGAGIRSLENLTHHTLTAGAGLTGGGDQSVDRTIDIGANADGSITVNANDIQVGVLASDSQHGILGGGTLHAIATTLANGFMPSTDKAKLDGISSGATNTPLTSNPPVDVTRSTAVVGVSVEAARSDHKHNVVTATPSATTPGGSVAEGSATSLSRSDHQHSLPSFGATSGTFCEGIDTRLSDDRTASGLRTITTVVAVSASTAPSAGQVLTASSGTSAAWEDPVSLATVPPTEVTKSAATPGVGVAASRADHKHDVSTATPGSVAIGTLAAEGTAISLARSDHQHEVASDTPSSIGTTNTDGSASTFSRSDHIHNHGIQTTGTHHAVVTASVNGFMLSTDKSKFDLMSPDFGRDYALVQSLGQSTTTATTFQTKVTLVTGPLTGTYLLTWYCLMSRPSGGNQISARLYNATSLSVIGGVWSKDQLQVTDKLQFSGAAVVTLSGTSNSYSIQYEGGGGNTASIEEARIEMWRVSA